MPLTVKSRLRWALLCTREKSRLSTSTQPSGPESKVCSGAAEGEAVAEAEAEAEAEEALLLLPLLPLLLLLLLLLEALCQAATLTAAGAMKLRLSCSPAPLLAKAAEAASKEEELLLASCSRLGLVPRSQRAEGAKAREGGAAGTAEELQLLGQRFQQLPSSSSEPLQRRAGGAVEAAAGFCSSRPAEKVSYTLRAMLSLAIGCPCAPSTQTRQATLTAAPGVTVTARGAAGEVGPTDALARPKLLLLLLLSSSTEATGLLRFTATGRAAL
jgi:hypothetical protein